MRRHYKLDEVVVPSQEDIDNKQTLLASHRRTLAHYLRQQALLGTARTPLLHLQREGGNVTPSIAD